MGSDAGVYFWDGTNELVLIVCGRITASEAYSLYHHVAAWLDKHPGSSVFVDLDHTNYVDSTTIGTFIKLHKKQRSAGQHMYLCNLSDPVAHIINQTKLTRYFSIIEDERLRSLENDAFKSVPYRPKEDMDSSFVLDAHNNICEIVPELRQKFATLLEVLADDHPT